MIEVDPVPLLVHDACSKGGVERAGIYSRRRRGNGGMTHRRERSERLPRLRRKCAQAVLEDGIDPVWERKF